MSRIPHTNGDVRLLARSSGLLLLVGVVVLLLPSATTTTIASAVAAAYAYAAVLRRHLSKLVRRSLVLHSRRHIQTQTSQSKELDYSRAILSLLSVSLVVLLLLFGFFTFLAASCHIELGFFRPANGNNNLHFVSI